MPQALVVKFFGRVNNFERLDYYWCDFTFYYDVY